MAKPILSAFLKFPTEATIVGRLLGGYTLLEMDVMNCVSLVRGDFDTVLKAMFRARGETQRLDIADAFGRHFYHDQKLGTEFEMALGAIRHCLRIRNQYSHCVWWDDNSGRLAFADLEDVARLNVHLVDLRSLPTRYVDVPLLEDQEAFFTYTSELLKWINFEGRYRADKLATQPLTAPKQINQPPLHPPN